MPEITKAAATIVARRNFIRECSVLPGLSFYGNGKKKTKKKGTLYLFCCKGLVANKPFFCVHLYAMYFVAKGLLQITGVFFYVRKFLLEII